MMKPVVIGAGLAGLSVALSMSPQPVLLLSPNRLGEGCASAWAQGGIAAAVGSDDTPKFHYEDTLRAGAGICDEKTVDQVTADAPALIERLSSQGVKFDRDLTGHLALGLEAAHGRRRIVHSSGDATGLKVIDALVRMARTTESIEILEDTRVVEILTDDHGVAGLRVLRQGMETVVPARQLVLATGGAGALWQHTTNPLGSWGSGLALAARVGARLSDLEFVQFHPTAIDVGLDPMPLASEALRGEGALLIDETGGRFTDELEARDIVARAIWGHLKKGHRVFLDARRALGERFPKRFPSIYNLCLASKIDPIAMPIPVRPAAHYHMGGVVTDHWGRTNIPGLWACGEVACTGLHGANRLASNSLLEAGTFGQRVAADLKNTDIRPQPRSSIYAQAGLSAASDSQADVIRPIMSAHVGVLRDGEGLLSALRQLRPMIDQSDMALAALMITVFSLQRQESRGAQARTDYPNRSAFWDRRQLMTLTEIMRNADHFINYQPTLAVSGV